MGSVLTEVLIILALILANGFFVLSEFALISSRKSRLSHLAKGGNKSAGRAVELIDKTDKALAAMQVGITFVATLAAVYGGATIVEIMTPRLAESIIPFVARNAHSIAVGAVVFSITFLTVVLGELAPKYVALAHAERITLAVVRPLAWMVKIFGSFTPLLSGSAKAIMWICGVRTNDRQGVVTEMDINLLMSEGREKGVFNRDEEELVRSALDFADTTAREAMTPRASIAAYSVDIATDVALKSMIAEGYSRYPIFQGAIDRVVGIVFLKDMFLKSEEGQSFTVQQVMRKPLFVPDSMELSILLRKMQSKRQHMAICLDEFGGTAGLITLEDILEELVGEIKDENDVEMADFVRESDTVAYVSGTLRPDELNEVFGTHVSEDESGTIAGLILQELDRVPSQNECVTIDGVAFTVLDVQGSRIRRLKVERKTGTQGGE